MGDGPKVEDRRNSVMVNDTGRAFQILIFDEGENSLANALGSLEIAKDIIKQHISVWRAQEAQRRGILVPKPNGNGGLHVQ